MKDIICIKCAYQWTPRKKVPKACPRCKTRLDITRGVDPYFELGSFKGAFPVEKK